MNRTQEEIVERTKAAQDIFGTEASDLIAYLDFAHAQEFLNDDAKEEGAESWPYPKEDTNPKQEAIDYMSFAWDKANNFRGLSAGRSLCHFKAWIWLMGNTELADSLDSYEYYGKDKLVEICNYLGLDPDTWDDGVRSNSETY